MGIHAKGWDEFLDRIFEHFSKLRPDLEWSRHSFGMEVVGRTPGTGELVCAVSGTPYISERGFKIRRLQGLTSMYPREDKRMWALGHSPARYKFFVVQGRYTWYHFELSRPLEEDIPGCKITILDATLWHQGKTGRRVLRGYARACEEWAAGGHEPFRPLPIDTEFSLWDDLDT